MIKRSKEFENPFLVILFPSASKPAEFYLCTSLSPKLEFTLFHGFSKKLQLNLNNNNSGSYQQHLDKETQNCVTIDFEELKSGYKFKLFSNCLGQKYQQQVFYGQHQMLALPNNKNNQINIK